MAKLHELLAAEKTPTAAWNDLLNDTIKKFKNPDAFFSGFEKSLSLVEDSASKEAEEAQARASKAVPTNVHDTLDFALDVWVRAEDIQYQKNKTNQRAVGTVMWKGQELLKDLPVDQLLGLEARLGKIRSLIEHAPTLDATKHWIKDTQGGTHQWKLREPERAAKTKKDLRGVVLHPGTDKHPPQVQAVTDDSVIGTFELMRFSGCCTAVQKANALLQIDNLIMEVKAARMRANNIDAETGKVGATLKAIILEAFK